MPRETERLMKEYNKRLAKDSANKDDILKVQLEIHKAMAKFPSINPCYVLVFWV